MRPAIRGAALLCLLLAACGTGQPERHVIFFLGDGMGIPVQTAARIYAHGEDGTLVMDTLPENGFVRTFSNDAMVTDSAASMTAYMTGVKTNNDVIGMTASSLYQSANGTPVPTIGELAKHRGWGLGVVTTTRVTHATPAAVYAHTTDRDLEEDIAVQLVPGDPAYNVQLMDGADVVFGGGTKQFSARKDGRDLLAALRAGGYTVATDRAGFNAISGKGRYVALFTPSHMSYDLDRDPAKEPSLAEMTAKAIDVLQARGGSYFLMVEGGRIDHALHDTNAKRALQDTIAFDEAISAALDKARAADPDLRNTTIVVTADHDHTMVLNGYARRTGPTTPTNAGVLGLVKDAVSGQILTDADGQPYSILGFGNGANRVSGPRSSAPALTESVTMANDYHQEAAIRMPVGGETHGGTDVSIMAIGHGAELFAGFLDNTDVFDRLLAVTKLPPPEKR